MGWLGGDRFYDPGNVANSFARKEREGFIPPAYTTKIGEISTRESTEPFRAPFFQPNNWPPICAEKKTRAFVGIVFMPIFFGCCCCAN